MVTTSGGGPPRGPAGGRGTSAAGGTKLGCRWFPRAPAIPFKVGSPISVLLVVGLGSRNGGLRRWPND